MSFIGIIIVIIFASFINREGPIPVKLKRLRELSRLFNLTRYIHISPKTKSHSKLQNGSEKKELEKNEQEITTEIVAREKTVAGAGAWMDIFDWLSFCTFVLYSILYFLAMVSLLT